jgi:hypothetical protein
LLLPAAASSSDDREILALGAELRRWAVIPMICMTWQSN